MKKNEYYARIEKAIDYIEANLEHDISLSSVSTHAFSSLSHFHRIFLAITGFTVKEYIRKRRLSTAAIELLLTKKKIIDIALKAQFDTPETFNKAFKKMYGLSPSLFRKEKPEFTLVSKLKLKQTLITSPTNINSSYIFSKEQTVVGVKTRTSLANQQQAKDIPYFFAEVMKKNLLSEIVNPHPKKIAGVYSDMSDEEEFDYTVGYLNLGPIKYNPHFVQHKLPSSEYARFTVKGPFSELAKAWQYIYGEWMPNSGRVRQKGLDYELYYQDKTEIYIPISSS